MLSFRTVVGGLLASTLVTSGLVALDVQPALATYAVPPTPAGLPSAIEPLQPYIGQSICDPVAKAGVVAFRNLLLRTYSDSGSLGIVRDCGAGGQSEHKEGRAFDWAMSAYNTRQAGEVATLISWLTRTDASGHTAAMARRLGIMYMIWNHKIWKAYDSRGWLAYDGPNPHTDHVHFSFGWAGARETTSYWDRTVAPIDFGPNPPPHVTPVRKPSNIALVHQYGGTTLSIPASGTAVTLVQKALLVSPADGDYGSGTAAAVTRLQVDQHLPVTGRFGAAEWKALFPAPIAPFGAVDAVRSSLGDLLVTGWALDADITGPVQVSATLDGTDLGTTSANLPRQDVAGPYPGYGTDHGFTFAVPTADGPHKLCVVLRNATGTPGTDTALPCATVSLTHNPVGRLEQVAQHLGVVHVAGYALDPDTADALTPTVTVDGAPVSSPLDAVTRTDIGALFPGLGDGHGFSTDLTLSAGSHQVCLAAPNATGTPGIDVALGCATVVVRHDPVGALTLVRRAPGGVQVSGWALDPDVAGPVTVDLLSDGAVVASPTADRWRAGLATSYPDQGSLHGFGTVLDLVPGTHTVCARVHNASGSDGTDRSIGCASVAVSHDAVGVAALLGTLPGGGIRVLGQAYDPDTLTAVTVTPWMDGKPLTPLTAGLSGTNPWPGYGTGHSFSTRLTALPGVHAVCLHAANASGTPGSGVAFGCRRVVVSSGAGAVTSTTLSWRTLTLRGWAIDPDTSTGTSVGVIVDGVLRTAGWATLYRAGFTTAQPGYGANHGFRVPLTLARGTHRVCVSVRNVRGTPGTSRVVDCRSISVP